MKLGLMGASALVCGIALAGCANIQTTSGADYLAAYDDPAYATRTSDIDADVRMIATIEPNISFPARIGLARIAKGRLVSVPMEEGRAWGAFSEQVDRLGSEFVPISPLIAESVAPRDESRNARRSVGQTLDQIRRGAARQHLDYVLIYETSAKTQKSANILAVADLTIIGAFVLPGREIEVEAVASGLLMDVRNGYPYATATDFAEEGAIARASRQRVRGQALTDEATLTAVKGLSSQMATALATLAEEFDQPRRAPASPPVATIQ